MIFVCHYHCDNKCKFFFHGSLYQQLFTSSRTRFCFVSVNIKAKKLSVLEKFLFFFMQMRAKEPQKTVRIIYASQSCLVINWMIKYLSFIGTQHWARNHVTHTQDFNCFGFVKQFYWRIICKGTLKKWVTSRIKTMMHHTGFGIMIILYIASQSFKSC